MDVRIAADGRGAAFVECLASGAPLAGERDVVGLLEVCIAHRAHAVLLHEGALAAGFFDLRTGLAGGVLQKLATYRVRAALVLSDRRHLGGRFGEMAREANRGTQFRVFGTRAAAAAWLQQPAPRSGASERDDRAATDQAD